jgi:HAD superfamily hydrolase (TIGR01549 family)
MKNWTEFRTILWDFDGVLMDSMPVRDKGFEEVLVNYPLEQIEQLLAYHRQNGGLSRYVKFRYFFEQIRQEAVSEEKINQLALSFSQIMRKALIKPELLIEDTLNFVKANQHLYNMHVVSGSDQNELRYLCQTLKLDQYFISIHGSPVAKKEIIHELLTSYKYHAQDVALIGDSVNDFEAAQINGIDFYGYNNRQLLNITSNYIHQFANV